MKKALIIAAISLSLFPAYAEAEVSVAQRATRACVGFGVVFGAAQAVTGNYRSIPASAAAGCGVGALVVGAGEMSVALQDHFANEDHNNGASAEPTNNLEPAQE